MADWYRYWKIVWNPVDIYDHLENWDIIESPHTKRKNERWFFYVKRKSYQNIWNKAWVSTNEKWRITDVYYDNNSWCSWWECYKYYYAVNTSRTKYVVLSRKCWTCDFNNIKEWNRCPCWEDRFFETLWPIDKKDGSYEVETAIYNENTFWYAHVNLSSLFTVDSGDYIFIKWISSWNSICWQGRLILDKVPYTWDWPYTHTLQLSQPRTNVNAWETLHWWLSIITTWLSMIPSFVGDNTIQTIVDWQWSWTLCDFWCPLSVQQHNWTLTYLSEQWYNFYWWTWFDWWSISALNNNNVWRDKIQSVSFKNFLVFFWKNSISTIVFNQEWTSSFLYNLREDIWIHNRWAYALFDNGLYFIGSDKRIYWASITWQNWFFDLQTEDITKNVFMHMDLVQDNDEVYMASEWWRLYVFINWRDDDRNSRTNKSKVLIYDKTYWQRLVHTICWESITWIKYWEFIWDDIYVYAWRDWDWSFPKRNYVAKAEAILYNNNATELKDSSWLPLDMFRRHKLVEWVFLLWMWKYTKENTYILVDKYDEYKYSRAYWIDDNNNVIKNWDDIMDWDIVRPDECFLNSLWKCDNVKNEYEWSHKNYKAEKDYCAWVTERRIFEDYCIAYDDNAYALSPIHRFHINFDESYADYWRVSFICWWSDIAYFWWMILKTDSETDFFIDVDNFTWDCCDKVIYCPKQSCS